MLELCHPSLCSLLHIFLLNHNIGIASHNMNTWTVEESVALNTGKKIVHHSNWRWKKIIKMKWEYIVIFYHLIDSRWNFIIFSLFNIFHLQFSWNSQMKNTKIDISSAFLTFFPMYYGNYYFILIAYQTNWHSNKGRNQFKLKWSF